MLTFCNVVIQSYLYELCKFVYMSYAKLFVWVMQTYLYAIYKVIICMSNANIVVWGMQKCLYQLASYLYELCKCICISCAKLDVWVIQSYLYELCSYLHEVCKVISRIYAAICMRYTVNFMSYTQLLFCFMQLFVWVIQLFVWGRQSYLHEFCNFICISYAKLFLHAMELCVCVL